MTDEDVTKEALGGSTTHCSTSGVSHGSFPNDVIAMRSLRNFLDFLPLSNDKSTLPLKPVTDSGGRELPALTRLVPDDPNTPYDMIHVIREVVDHGDLFEIMPEYAKNIVTGFGRMEGQTGNFFR